MEDEQVALGLHDDAEHDSERQGRHQHLQRRREPQGVGRLPGQPGRHLRRLLHQHHLQAVQAEADSPTGGRPAAPSQGEEEEEQGQVAERFQGGPVPPADERQGQQRVRHDGQAETAVRAPDEPGTAAHLHNGAPPPRYAAESKIF